MTSSFDEIRHGEKPDVLANKEGIDNSTEGKEQRLSVGDRVLSKHTSARQLERRSIFLALV